MNMTQIIGHLGSEPEMRYTPQGKAITSFSVAVGRKYTNAAGEKVQETTWFRCSAWEQKAELAKQYLHKGSRVYVRGRLTSDPATGGPKLWTRQDGTAGASFELTVDEMEFLTSRAEADGTPAAQAAQTAGGVNVPAAVEPDDDQIPF